MANNQNPLKTIRNHQTLLQTIRNYFKPSETITNHQTLLQPIRNYFKPSQTIRNYYKPLHTLKNHHKPFQTIRNLRFFFEPSNKFLQAVRNYQNLKITRKDHQITSKTLNDSSTSAEFMGVPSSYTTKFLHRHYNEVSKLICLKCYVATFHLQYSINTLL